MPSATPPSRTPSRSAPVPSPTCPSRGWLTAGDPGGAFRLLRQPPAAAATVFTYTEMIENLAVSPDVRYTAWVDVHFTARVVRHADLSSCTLNATARHAAFDLWFPDRARRIFWNEEAPEDPDRKDGYFADPDGCQGKQRFAQGVELALPIGDRALVYGDEHDAARARVSLEYAALRGGTEWPAAGPVRIHGDVDDSSVSLVG